ncbi:MAG: hypothetical protein A2283_03440 [Lentisphaerae bacterium RIFOXYA12_FULL_48_11]|nr:MAG: hypothetical protein A2283_03440 [Lentisphaerae bacterium RIFOXYA12_FULL_48_11]
MNVMKKRSYLTGMLVLAVSLVCMWNVSAQPGVSGDLNADLSKLREDIAKAGKDADRADAALRKYEHDVVYTSPQAVKLYEDIKKLEKQMVTKRKALQEMLNSTPEFHEKNKAYLVAYGKLDSLRREEQILLKKIRDGGVKEPGKDK